jgi:hypothetical protein
VWRYEIRDDQDRLLDMRREYFTEQAAQEAGTLALRAIQESRPIRELRLKTETDG